MGAQAYANAYRSAEVRTVSQRDLIVQLYRGAERFLTQATVAMANHEIESAHNGCQRATAIFNELLSTLNFAQGGDTAAHLRDLYVFFISTITEGNLRKRPEGITRILPLIADLRMAWEQVPAEHANVSAAAVNDGHALNLRT